MQKSDSIPKEALQYFCKYAAMDIHLLLPETSPSGSD